MPDHLSTEIALLNTSNNPLNQSSIRYTNNASRCWRE